LTLLPLAVLAAAAVVPAGAVATAAATTYTTTDLGSLGLGKTDGSGINATGEVTGTSYLSTLVPTLSCPPVYGNTRKTCVEHPWHAFAASNGQMSDLGTVRGGDFSGGHAINLSGQVAGSSATNDGGGVAILWDGAKLINLGQLAPLSGSDSAANGIDDSGQVVGQYGTNNSDHAFLYSGGSMTALPEPSITGPAGCAADAINNTGQIAGACQDASGQAHLVLWYDGAVRDLGTLGAPGSWSFTQTVSINNTGQIAGTVFVEGGTQQGFLYNNGAVTSLGNFLAASINDNGVMIGGPSIDTDGTVQNLNTLIPAGSPQIQDATAINDNGQIVANTTSSHALLLTPS
jgi:probable HAF family extracellular repeat protein